MPINSFLYPGAKFTPPYQVSNSLRFNQASSDHLTITPGSAGNRRTFTISFWFKRSTLGTANRCPFSVGNSGSSTSDADWFTLMFHGSTNTLRLIQYNNTLFATNQVFRDSSAWAHIVIAVDTTDGTAGDRIKLYINGSQVTSFSSSSNPSQNYDFPVNNTVEHMIGREDGNANVYFDGYLAEYCIIDGSALAPTSFGEFDSDSPTIWKPKSVSGLTFGTNGFYLEFKQSGTSQNSSGLGADTSGNDNHFAVNNLTAVDQSTDTCTNNFATLNPLSTVFTENISSMLSEGNTKYDPTGDYSIVKSTIPFPKSGKWYIEIKLADSGTVGGQFGVMRTPASSNATNSFIGYATNEAGYAYDNGEIHRSAGGSGDTRVSVAASLGGYSLEDTLAILFNADDNEIKWYIQDSLKYTLDLSSAPHGFYANDGEWVFALSSYGNYVAYNFNFGSPSVSISSGNTDGNGYGNFEFDTKGGYALCTKNLAEFG